MIDPIPKQSQDYNFPTVRQLKTPDNIGIIRTRQLELHMAVSYSYIHTNSYNKVRLLSVNLIDVESYSTLVLTSNINYMIVLGIGIPETWSLDRHMQQIPICSEIHHRYVFCNLWGSEVIISCNSNQIWSIYTSLDFRYNRDSPIFNQELDGCILCIAALYIQYVYLKLG